MGSIEPRPSGLPEASAGAAAGQGGVAGEHDAQGSLWTFAGESARVDTTSTITLLQGSSFVISRRSGDITTSVDGVYLADTRLCHHLVVLLDGEVPEPLATASDEPGQGRFIGRLRDRGVLLRRTYAVGQGLRAQLRIDNVTGEARRVEVSVEVASDLADLFEVKELRATREPVRSQVHGPRIFLGDPHGRRAATVTTFPPPDHTDGRTLHWTAVLEPRGQWEVCLELGAIRGGEVIAVVPGCGEHGLVALPVTISSVATAATVRSDVPHLDEKALRVPRRIRQHAPLVRLYQYRLRRPSYLYIRPERLGDRVAHRSHP